MIADELRIVHEAIQQAKAEEREACAKIAEVVAEQSVRAGCYSDDARLAAVVIAATIRGRGAE